MKNILIFTIVCTPRLLNGCCCDDIIDSLTEKYCISKEDFKRKDLDFNNRIEEKNGYLYIKQEIGTITKGDFTYKKGSFYFKNKKSHNCYTLNSKVKKIKLTLI